MSQLVFGLPHQAGGVLDLVLTDAPELTAVNVFAPIGCSDPSHLSISLSLRQYVPEVNVACEVFFKSAVNWNQWVMICHMHLGRRFVGPSIPVVILIIFFRDLLSHHILKRRILVRSTDKPWFTAECRRAFDGKQWALWTVEKASYGCLISEFPSSMRAAICVLRGTTLIIHVTGWLLWAHRTSGGQH